MSWRAGIAAALLVVSCSRERSFSNELTASVDELNEKCPVQVDSETRLDAIALEGDSVLVYRHTLNNISTSNADTAMLKRQLWPGLLSNIRVSRDLRKMRDHKVTFKYHYRDKSGQQLALIVITPADYQ